MNSLKVYNVISINPLHCLLLGDSGYPQRSYLMTPVLNAEPGSRQEAYTKAHIRARNTIERAFGVLKGRFRCLIGQRMLYYQPDFAAQIIIACVVLHNMIVQSRGAPVYDDIEPIFNLEDQEVVEDRGSDIIVGRAVRDRLISNNF